MLHQGRHLAAFRDATGGPWEAQPDSNPNPQAPTRPAFTRPIGARPRGLTFPQLRARIGARVHPSVRAPNRLAFKPAGAVDRLVAALGARGGAENVQLSGSTRDAIVEQSGAVDPASVRLQVKENRKLSPAEVVELVDAYQAGVSQAELTRGFGVHEQTVRAHLRRQGMKLRPLRALAEEQEGVAVRLYVEEMWSLAELAVRFKVGQTAIRNVLVRRGAERRAAAGRVRTG